MQWLAKGHRVLDASLKLYKRKECQVFDGGRGAAKITIVNMGALQGQQLTSQKRPIISAT